MERVARYAAERGVDVPGTGGVRGGEAGQQPLEGASGGVGGDGGGGDTEEGAIDVDREARVPGEQGVPRHEDVPEVYPGTGERMEGFLRRAAKGPVEEGSSKRKECGTDPPAAPAGKRHRQQKVTDVLLEQPGSSPRAVLHSHIEIASMEAVETHREELAEELEEVRQPFWITGATLLSDGRKSRDGRPIVNFLAAGSRGVVVYTTINCEGEPDNAVHVLRRWVTIFHEFSFGSPQQVNAICTNSASARRGDRRQQQWRGKMAVEGGLADTTIAGVVDQIVVAAAASLLEEMEASVLAEEAPAPGRADAVEGQAGAAGGAARGAAGGAAALDRLAARRGSDAVGGGMPGAVEEEIGAQAKVSRGGGDERFMQQFLTEQYDPVMAGMTPGVARGLGMSDSQIGSQLDLDLSMGLPPSCGGATSTDRAPSRDDTAGESLTQPHRAVDEAVQAGRRRDEGVGDARCVVRETTTGLVVPFSGLHLAQGRQSQPVPVEVHGVPPPVITDLGPEPVVAPLRLPSHFAPQEVRRPLDADELAREAVRDVTCLDRRVIDQRLQHPPWQAIPPDPWGPASPVWSGSTSTGARTAGDVPGVSGGVVETAPRSRDMPPPPPRPPVGDPSSSPTGRGSRSPHTPRRSRIRDTTTVVGDVSDTTLFGRTDIDLDSTRRVTEHSARLQPGLGPRGGRMTAAREVAASGCEPQRGRDRGVSADSLEYALMAATPAVHEQTPRKRRVPPRPRPVPAEGGDALGETSGAEGLGMPRGSRREQTVIEASARVVVLRKAGAPVTIEEDDLETDVAVREEDEDYEGEEE
ncbi:hypothetical protein CBR_g22327 [Chara braunii]|uniref:DUF659 domain-containing protein n=1 Tax=Chara braunii TaxID=69332 RepID=A0A388JUS6_CHABU|nr:hypothetical protein CBR_g22327 [Chara braunii]|eukprot:GBG61530.1 hypothetical protein CBR_g22327 [Chara braunii]